MAVGEVVELLFQVRLVVAEKEDYHLAVYVAEVVYQGAGVLVGEPYQREVLLGQGEFTLVSRDVDGLSEAVVPVAAVVLHGNVEDEHALVVGLSRALLLVKLYQLFVVPLVGGVAA